MRNFVLYNPKSGDSGFSEKIRELRMDGCENALVNVLEIDDYAKFVKELANDDRIIIAGGDGSLNQFVNRTAGLAIANDIFMYSGGTGNDFLFDIGVDSAKEGPVKINKYLENLPKVEVNGQTFKFINNVGFGIDGYCCEEGDRLKEAGKRKISYASIAIKGILGKFSSRNAKVTVDGKTREYENVWLAPTMNGRAYGGGMMIAPDQDRLNKERLLSVVVFKGSSRIRSLLIFPTFFKGEHVKYSKNVFIEQGKDIMVEFDRPTPLQIDGETVPDVTLYRAVSSALG